MTLLLASIIAGCGEPGQTKDREPPEEEPVEAVSHDATNAARPEPLEPSRSASVPPIQVRPARLEMGPTVRDADAWSTIEIVNVGTEPVAIRRLASSCPCLEGVADGVVIPAGESYEAPVRYNAPFALGPQTRTLHVLVEGFEGSTPVEVSILSVPGLTLDPPAIDPAAQERVTVTLRSTDDAEFRVLRVTPPALPGLNALLESGPASEIRFEWTRAAWEEAGGPASIILHTDRKDDPRAILQTNAAAANTLRAPAEGASPSGEDG